MTWNCISYASFFEQVLSDCRIYNRGHTNWWRTTGATLGGAVYTVRVGDAVHVLHAFQKKSKSGIATPQPDVELVERAIEGSSCPLWAH